MRTYSYATRKISYSSTEELQEKINGIDGKIISIKPCIPSFTDTNMWVSVYYEFELTAPYKGLKCV